MAPQFAALPENFEYKSEEKVYNVLKGCPDDWIIIPSVKPQLQNQNQRQIDYVLIIPGTPKEHRGAVICLEVKGGSYYIDKTEGFSWYGFAGGTKKRMNSPIDDAFNRTHIFENWLQEKLNENPPSPAINLDKIGFDYAVFFPDSNIEDPDKLRVFNKEVFNNNQLVEKLIKLTKDIGTRQYAGSKNPRFNFLRVAEATVLRDRMLTKGERQIFVRHGDIGKTNWQLTTLTEEQFSNLSVVQNTDGSIRTMRVLFQGGAGTGKTMLAMELAKRRSKAGDKVAFILSTPAVAQWARESLKDEVALVGSLADVLFAGNDELNALGAKHQEAQNRNAIRYPSDIGKVNETLEYFALKAIDILYQRDLRWDYLIIDELQYLQLPAILPILDLALNDGLRRGKWAMFGDFKTQNLDTNYSLMLESSERDLRTDLTLLEDVKLSLDKALVKEEGEQVYYPMPELTINCRNSFEIASAAAQVVGQSRITDLNIKAQKVIGVEPRIRYWTEDAELKDLLAEEFSQLNDAGVTPNEVKILYHDYMSIFDRLNEVEVTSGLWYLRFHDERKAQRQRRGPRRIKDPVDAYQIRDFAGLESDIIILVVGEIAEGVSIGNPYANSYYSQLFYVGISRAKTSVIILSHVSHEELLARVKLDGIT